MLVARYNMKTKEELFNLFRLINSVDWSDQTFSIKKAYICAQLSSYTYLEIHDYELKSNNRVNLIPSYAYKKVVASGKISTLSPLFEGNDFGSLFTIIREYVIILGIKTPKVLFIAIRGSKHLYDWKVNFTFSKKRLNYLENDIAFHSGFYFAILDCLTELIENIYDYHHKRTPICITGHSLGGALSAILNALWYPQFPFESLQQRIYLHEEQPQCYTFGMPRYGNKSAIMLLNNPFHVFNKNDIVPFLPPHLFGYHNSRNEYLLETNLIKLISRRDIRQHNFRPPSIRSYGIKYHMIDYYLQLLEKIDGSN
jgi:hypothetical protein